MSEPAPRALRLIELGRVPYAEALALQRAWVERLRGPAGADLPDLLLCCEHEEVVTTGRAQQVSGDPRALDAVQAAGVPVHDVERGGHATWHGPGQLVGYPLVRLAPGESGSGERDLHRYLRALETALIEGVAAVTGLRLERRAGLTGAWTPAGRKLASIGVACRGWVTYHGFALNLDPDLSRLTLFRPCDLEASLYSSLAAQGAPHARGPLRDAIHGALARALDRRPERGEPRDALAPLTEPASGENPRSGDTHVRDRARPPAG